METEKPQLNPIKARILILLNQLPPKNQKISFLAAKLCKSYTYISTNLAILKAEGKVIRNQSASGVIFWTTKEEEVEIAKTFLGEMEGEMINKSEVAENG